MREMREKHFQINNTNDSSWLRWLSKNRSKIKLTNKYNITQQRVQNTTRQIFNSGSNWSVNYHWKWFKCINEINSKQEIRRRLSPSERPRRTEGPLETSPIPHDATTFVSKHASRKICSLQIKLYLPFVVMLHGIKVEWTCYVDFIRGYCKSRPLAITIIAVYINGMIPIITIIKMFRYEAWEHRCIFGIWHEPLKSLFYNYRHCNSIETRLSNLQLIENTAYIRKVFKYTLSYDNIKQKVTKGVWKPRFKCLVIISRISQNQN